MRWIALLILPWALAVPTRAADSQIDDPVAQFEQHTGSRIGFVAINSKTGRRSEHRSNERFLMCSTFKLLAVTAILQRVDQGQEKLDRFVPYTQSDILEYAPVTKQHLSEGGMTLGSLCKAAIEQSDNTAGNLLLQAVGGAARLTNFARSIGDETTRLDRVEPDLNVPKDEQDTTSPEAMCNDLVRILTSDLLSQKSRKLIQDWLFENETGAALIRAGVPKDWHVGDKTGRSSKGATNDVAVLYPPNGERMFLVIYVDAPSISDETRSEIIANFAREMVATLGPN